MRAIYARKKPDRRIRVALRIVLEPAKEHEPIKPLVQVSRRFVAAVVDEVFPFRDLGIFQGVEDQGVVRILEDRQGWHGELSKLSASGESRVG